MQKIIGLDIGSYSIKAVEILNHFKSYEISNFYENIIPQIDELPQDAIITACMEQLFAENHLKADRIITAMPGQYISSRIVTLNFTDSSKIEAAVLSEVEDAVPFNLEDMIVDYQVLGNHQGQTAALVVMTKKTFLSSFLEHLQRIKIDPKLVDVDSLSFYNLCPYLEMVPDQCYGIVDVGHEKTSVCLVQNGILRMFRSINLGGRYITEFLARDLEVSFNEAQRIKHRVSCVLTENYKGEDLSPQDRLISDRITIAANSIVKELGRTLYAFKTWEKSPIQKIFISGGTSVIKNFSEYLTHHLETMTVLNELPQTQLKINPTVVNQIPVMAQGISIGLRAVTSVKRHSQINLRKGEFAYVQDYESLLRGAGSVFKIITACLVILCVSYAIKYFTYNSQIESLQETYKKEFLSAFPDMKTKYGKTAQPFSKLKKDSISMLKDRIKSKHDAANDFINLNKDSGALIVLQRISEKVPKDVKINLVEYKYTSKPDGTGLVRIRVEADSFDTIAKFKEALKGVKVFDEIAEKSSDSKPGSDIKIAVIETNYKPTGQGG